MGGGRWEVGGGVRMGLYAMVQETEAEGGCETTWGILCAVEVSGEHADQARDETRWRHAISEKAVEAVARPLCIPSYGSISCADGGAALSTIDLGHAVLRKIYRTALQLERSDTCPRMNGAL